MPHERSRGTHGGGAARLPLVLLLPRARRAGGPPARPGRVGDGLSCELARVFQFGSQSVLTLHRLAPAHLGLADVPLDPAKVSGTPTPTACPRKLQPVDRAQPCEQQPEPARESRRPTSPFRPAAPAEPGARRVLWSAGPAKRVASAPRPRQNRGRRPRPHLGVHAPDITRDINGAGLVSRVLLLHLGLGTAAPVAPAGRSEEQFLQRRVIDQKVASSATRTRARCMRDSRVPNCAAEARRRPRSPTWRCVIPPQAACWRSPRCRSSRARRPPPDAPRRCPRPTCRTSHPPAGS